MRPRLVLLLACYALASCGGGAATTQSPQASECATARAAWIWCDDFEIDRMSSYFEVVAGSGSFVRVGGVGRNGSTALRGHFNVGQVSAGSVKLAFGRTPGSYFDPVDAGTQDYREIYWRFYLRNEEAWTGGGGDKLSRATVLAKDDWSQAMIAHVWSGSSPNQNYLVLDPASGTSTSGTLMTSGYNDFSNLRWLGATRATTPIFDATHVGQWYCIEAHVKLNTVGQSNGVFELRINGVVEVNQTTLNWLGDYSAYGINAIFLENYWNAGSPASQDRYFDNFVVSTGPIGC